MRWYRKAAEQGLASAQHNLVCMPTAKALPRMMPKPCAGKGRRTGTRTQANLGFMYATGEGIADDAEAVRWWRRAAEQGDARAQYSLGAMYANGKGIAEDDAEAVRWWRRAAEQGHRGAV